MICSARMCLCVRGGDVCVVVVCCAGGCGLGRRHYAPPGSDQGSTVLPAAVSSQRKALFCVREALLHVCEVRSRCGDQGGFSCG